MSWHVEPDALRDYHAGRVTPTNAVSIEAHLTSCAECRSDLAEWADPDRLARNWAAIQAHVDQPRLSWGERALRGLGVSESRARLIAMTPALGMPGLLAAASVLAAMTLLNVSDGGVGDLYVFLVIAPLLPLVGVAVAFNRAGDPAAELAAAAPMPAWELMLTRANALIGASTVLTAAASLFLPYGWEAAAWLLPSLGLCSVALALSTWVPASWSATGVSVVWVGAAAASWRLNRLESDVLDRFAAWQPAGQMVFAILAVAGVVVLTTRRHALDLRRVS
jgi:hypothetical protein